MLLYVDGLLLHFAASGFGGIWDWCVHSIPLAHTTYCVLAPLLLDQLAYSTATNQLKESALTQIEALALALLSLANTN
jgi:hypothetical protein